MHIMADCAATLGSRFNLIFDPSAGCTWHNSCGEFREQALRLRVGVRLPDGQTLLLPFAGGDGGFPYLEQFSTLTTIKYRGVHPSLGIDFRMKVMAPFYPQDPKLSTAPFFYVDLSVATVGAWRGSTCERPAQSGEIVLAIAGEGLEFGPAKSGFTYDFPSTSRPGGAACAGDSEPAARTVTVHSTLRCPEAEPDREGALRRAFDLSQDEPAAMRLVWSSWQDEAVLEIKGEPAPFKYHQFFQSEGRMLAWAQRQRESVEERCAFLDGLFESWSLGRATTSLSALALHSLLACTWWVRRKDGRDWFSVWEGSRYLHSTVDEEYNTALLYFALWPGLLEMLLEEWAESEVDGQERLGPQAKGSSFLCHDMGSMLAAGTQAYAHHMAVEENANYLLLLAASAFFSGDTDQAQRRLTLCRRLAEFIVRADTNGNGFPDDGTANTIDDAGPAVQFCKEQVYLAVKAQAALWALAELEDLLCAEKKEKSKGERWKAWASKGVKTLGEKAWLGDHFAVTLTRSTEGLEDPRTGGPLPAGELEGWDDCSIYAGNGLLYLFLADIKMPRWNLSRFAQDVETAELAARTPYGSTHTARGNGAVWFSQNLWRDFVAAYLGVDMLCGTEAYWDYQVLTGDNLDSALYCDTTPQGNLGFYPRGATVFGAAMSAAGLRLDRVSGELSLTPMRKSLRVPLLPLTDWKKMRCPWLTVRTREGVTTASISDRELLGKLVVRIDGAELEQA